MNHDHLPTLEAVSLADLHPFLQTIVRAGGGRIAYSYHGGIGDVPCLVDCELLPHLIWLHYDRETRQYVPGMLTDNDTKPVVLLTEVALHLPSLVTAFDKSINHPANRTRAA